MRWIQEDQSPRPRTPPVPLLFYRCLVGPIRGRLWRKLRCRFSRTDLVLQVLSVHSDSYANCSTRCKACWRYFFRRTDRLFALYFSVDICRPTLDRRWCPKIQKSLNFRIDSGWNVFFYIPLWLEFVQLSSSKVFLPGRQQFSVFLTISQNFLVSFSNCPTICLSETF